MKKILLILILIFSFNFTINAQEQMSVNDYHAVVKNFKEVISKEFKEDYLKKLKFKKNNVIIDFKSLPQIEKDIYLFQQSKFFTINIKKFEKKCCQELLNFNELESKPDLPSKEDLINIIKSLQEIEKTHIEQSIIFTKELIERNKIEKEEAARILSEIMPNDTILKDVP